MTHTIRPLAKCAIPIRVTCAELASTQLCAARVQLRMSREQLALRIGIGTTSLFRYETGERVVPADVLLAVQLLAKERAA